MYSDKYWMLTTSVHRVISTILLIHSNNMPTLLASYPQVRAIFNDDVWSPSWGGNLHHAQNFWFRRNIIDFRVDAQYLVLKLQCGMQNIVFFGAFAKPVKTRARVFDYERLCSQKRPGFRTSTYFNQLTITLL